VPQLALVGNLSLDRVDGGAPRIGGGPYYAALALRALGRPARILSRCAPAERRLFTRSLAAVGYPPTLLPSAETAAFRLRYEGTERQVAIEALADPWTPDEVEPLRRGGWVHLAPLARSDFPPETVAELARGRRVLLDGQGLVRPGRTGPVVLDAAFDPELLRHVTVLKLSESEAAVLGPLGELGVPEVVVTLGPRGATVVAGGRSETVSAGAVRAADPTGAGDAFAAAYLAARADGFPPAPAARRAGSLVAALLHARTRAIR
jgi:sugar/nucleoside kinase (ribokinase family)